MEREVPKNPIWGPDPPELSDEKYVSQVEALEPFIIKLQELRKGEGEMGNDPVMRAFFGAALERIYDPAQFSFRDYLQNHLLRPLHHEVIRYDMAVQKLERAIHRPALFDPEWRADPEHPVFPVDFKRREAYHQLIDWIFQGRKVEDDFGHDLFRQLKTPVPQRYVILPITINLFRQAEGRFMDEVRILDIGTSLGDGLKMVALGMPFNTPEVYRGKNAERLRPDFHLTNYIGEMALKGFELGPSIGIDREDPQDIDSQEWAMACLRPKEYLDESLMAQYEILHDARDLPSVKIMRLDITDTAAIDQAVEERKIEFSAFDIVMTSMTMYEIPPLKQPFAVRNALRFVKPDGLFIRHEFGYVNKQGAYRYYSDPYALPYRCRTTISDRLLSHADPGHNHNEPFYRWRDGRCNELWPDTGARRLIRKAIRRSGAQLPEGA
jgi:SAM-dependent methyltransferase